MLDRSNSRWLRSAAVSTEINELRAARGVLSTARMRKFIIIMGWLAVKKAHACGCFAPPDPTVPLVQAGEQIAFAMDNGNVTAHIQISYAGPASDFGWLLPLPSEPTLELGSDELFAKLQAATSPQWNLTRVYDADCQNSFYGGASDLGAFASADGGIGGPASPLAFSDSIGPYDYAILHADSKDDMLKWLNDNHYFIPTGTSAAVDPYIHPGAYFLALKLKSGASAGDLQPVVVHYQSDLPMIPIILTSAGAQENMGIYVWILGQMRAIPRNYYHTVLNEAVVDWNNNGANYRSVVTQAVSEAPKKHSFVTEFAGASSIMKNRINYPGRFGSIAVLKSQPDPDTFLEYLKDHDYPYTTQLLSILEKYFPLPANSGLTPGQFYYNLTLLRIQRPDLFVGWMPNYVPDQIGDEIDMRVVQPTVNASAMFDDHPYLTRLFTTLSPEDMTEDPVFSFNPYLPDVSNQHKATVIFHCHGSYPQYNTPATLVTETGWTVEYPNGLDAPPSTADLPAAQRTEATTDDGVNVISEHDPPQPELALNGCDIATTTTTSTGALLLLVALLLLRRRCA
jgi:hypothetical protein